MVRFKNRWILVEFIPITLSSDQQTKHGRAQLASSGADRNAKGVALDTKAIWVSMKQSIIANFGDTGWGKVGLSLTVKYFSPTTNTCIIRVARDQHNIAWAGLTMITAIDGNRYIPNVVHVSGTIKHAQLAAIAHNREVIARYRALAGNPAGYEDAYDAYLDTTEKDIEALQD